MEQINENLVWFRENPTITQPCTHFPRSVWYVNCLCCFFLRYTGIVIAFSIRVSVERLTKQSIFICVNIKSKSRTVLGHQNRLGGNSFRDTSEFDISKNNRNAHTWRQLQDGTEMLGLSEKCDGIREEGRHAPLAGSTTNSLVKMFIFTTQNAIFYRLCVFLPSSTRLPVSFSRKVK